MHKISPDARTAVLLAHPGHELVIHGLMEHLRPRVAILTDGSGAEGTSRVASTTRLLEPIGGTATSFYGNHTDRQCYAALLEHDEDLFIGMAEHVAELLVRARIEIVIGDAAEGWNPIHDIWRSVVDTAVSLARMRSGSDIRNFDFLLFGCHRTAADAASSDAVVLHLDDAGYTRKLDAGNLYEELHAEVQAALRGSTEGLVPAPLAPMLDARLGLSSESYRWEVLRPVDELAPPRIALPRVYELYGEMVVAEGRYQETIRYEQHLRPIEAALRRHAVAELGSPRVCASSSPLTT